MTSKLILLFALSLAHAKDRTTCSVKELVGRDCHLQMGELSLDFLDQTVAWNDGTWRSVDPMPLSGEGIEWEKIIFTRVGPKALLQMWIWDKGVGEMQVQSLHWYVSTIQARKFRVLAEGVVRKRHLEQSLVAASGTAPAPRAKYLNDAPEKHGIQFKRGAEFQWTLGGQSKSISLSD